MISLERKQNLIADLQPYKVLSEQYSAIADLEAALASKRIVVRRVRASRQHLEEARAFLTLTVEGKNAEQRAAALVLAQRDDQAYQAAATDLADAEEAEDGATHNLEVARAKLDAAKQELRIIAGTLAVLAS